jgi:hypothetical protein
MEFSRSGHASIMTLFSLVSKTELYGETTVVVVFTVFVIVIVIIIISSSSNISISMIIDRIG